MTSTAIALPRCVLTSCGNACWNSGALITQTFFSNCGVGRSWLCTNWTSKETWPMHSGRSFRCRGRVIVDLKTHDNDEHLSAQLGQHFEDCVLSFAEFSGMDVRGHCIKGLAEAMIQAGAFSTASFIWRASGARRAIVLASYLDDFLSNHITTDILDVLSKWTFGTAAGVAARDVRQREARRRRHVL